MGNTEELEEAKDSLNRKCRGCRQTENLEELFKDSVWQLFSESTGLLPQLHDGLPALICSECLSTCQSIAAFRQNCLINDAIFRNELLIKVEVKDPLTDITVKCQDPKDYKELNEFISNSCPPPPKEELCEDDVDISASLSNNCDASEDLCIFKEIIGVSLASELSSQDILNFLNLNKGTSM